MRERGKHTVNVCVVGGGAAGLCAAIAAARSGARVRIIEHGGRVGRKILASGNGRCNLSNTNISPKFYHGGGAEYFENIYSAFDARAFFETLGVMTRTEEGRIYPYTNMASSVLDALRFECARLNVKIETDTSFIAAHNEKVIIACGGKSYAQSGSDGSGYEILRNYSHTITPLFPTLVPIKIAARHPKGVRAEARVTLGGKEEYGEVQFTEGFVSGIAVLNLSRGAKGKDISFDFFPRYGKEELIEIIDKHKKMYSEAQEVLCGMLHPQLAGMLLRAAGVEKMTQSSGSINSQRLCGVLKNFTSRVEGVHAWQNAQATAGGAACDEFNPETLESKKQSGVYAAGEVLDIDGDSGGYNLHWAWASGIRAGEAAAK